MKNQDRFRLAYKIKNPHRISFSLYTQFMNSRSNYRHRTTERHPKIDTFLKVSECLSNMKTDRWC